MTRDRKVYTQQARVTVRERQIDSEREKLLQKR